MPTNESIVNQFLSERKSYNDLEQIKKVTKNLFQLALSDKDAAAALLKEPNRFAQAIGICIEKNDLLKFAKKYPQLVEKLLDLTIIVPEMAEKMRLAAVQPVEASPALPERIKTPAKEQLAINGRTNLAILLNDNIKKQNDKSGVIINKEFVPIVDRHVRDFNQKLCSAGASNSREIIFLDPKDLLLEELYSSIKKRTKSGAGVEDTLKLVSKLTRKCFKNHTPKNLIHDQLSQEKKVISLSKFIENRQGLCRHHALLNAYFLSRLTQDNLLDGEVIHHRQNLNNSAHTWNLFHDKKSDKWYSLDSLWNNITCINDNPGTLDTLYKSSVEELINERYRGHKSQLKQNCSGEELNPYEPKKDGNKKFEKIDQKPPIIKDNNNVFFQPIDKGDLNNKLDDLNKKMADLDFGDLIKHRFNLKFK